MRILNGLEISQLLEELKPALIDARLQKVYQLDNKKILLRFYKTGVGELDLMLIAGSALYLTKKKYQSPEQPSGFCMALRKKLIGLRLSGIIQKNYERIVELVFQDKYKLILEILKPGIFILADKDYKILLTSERTDFKDRPIKFGEVYKYPKASEFKPKQTEKIKDINEKLDEEFFPEFKIEKESKFEKEKKKLQTILEAQKLALQEANKSYEEHKSKADLILSNIQEVSNLLKSRKYEFKNIKLNYQRDARQNASAYYEKAKKFKQKIPAIEKILKETEQKFMNLEKAMTSELIAKETRLKAQGSQPIAQKKWYQKFHWFYTSGGFLAIGGRDATQNDILIKKYRDKDDIVFHTEWPGSPFFILKDIRKLKSLPDTDVREVATATASYSRAWKSGVGSTDVYWVLPEQVSKQARPGEYLGKGAFMIYGKKNMMRSVILELAVGIDREENVFSGPKSAVAKYCKAYSIVRPGREKKSDLAKKIAKRLGTGQIDAIVAGLPAGEGTIVKSSL